MIDAVGPEAFAVFFVALGAFTQAITGFGFSLICAPLLTLGFGAADGVRLANLLSILVNMLLYWRERKNLEFRRAFSLLIPALVGGVATRFLLEYLTDDALSVLTGALVLIAVVLISSGRKSRRMSGKRGGLAAGSVSGAMNVAGGVGGPAIAIYAANAQWSPSAIRGTFAVYGIGLNVFSVAVRGVGPISIAAGAAFVTALAVGFALGAVWTRKLDAPVVRRWTLALAAFGSLAAIVKGVT